MQISMNAGRDVMSAKLAAAESRVSRFMWAGALANGAALVSLVGLIGNVSSPDAALSALSIPLLLFATGVFAGGQAGGHLAVIAELELMAATDAALYEAAIPAAVSDSLKELQVAVAILESRFYGEARPSPKRLADAKSQFEEIARFIARRASQQAATKARRVGRLGAWAMTSFGCLLIGMTLIVAGHALGVQLQPDAPARREPIVAPSSSGVIQRAPPVSEPRIDRPPPPLDPKDVPRPLK